MRKTIIIALLFITSLPILGQKDRDVLFIFKQQIVVDQLNFNFDNCSSKTDSTFQIYVKNIQLTIDTLKSNLNKEFKFYKLNI